MGILVMLLVLFGFALVGYGLLGSGGVGSLTLGAFSPGVEEIVMLVLQSQKTLVCVTPFSIQN